jgi:hypothetical protein
MSNKIEGAMSAPPAFVAGLSLAGVSLQDWVLIGTLMWLTLQISWFCYTRVREWSKKDE